MLVSNIGSNHQVHIQNLIAECKNEFVIVSPFLASQMKNFLDKFNFDSLNRIDLVTTFRPCDIEQFTKSFQIRDFIQYFEDKHPKISVRVHVDNKLHGKLYISKTHNKQMIITSANFTQRGMNDNHEWGILVNDEEIIQNALAQVFDSIEYPEVSLNQIDKACKIAERYKAEFPDLVKKPNITYDILEVVYSDINIDNTNPMYFLKPYGHTERPITLEDQEDFSTLNKKIHFAKRPQGVKKGDIIITTAVGAGSLLSYYRLTGGIQEVSSEDLSKDPELKRWPWYIEGRNQSPEFGKAWWKYDLKRQILLDEFKFQNPNIDVTHAGGSTLGTINRGNDKVRLTKEFGEFLIAKIETARMIIE